MDMFLCPTCGGSTELHESPLCAFGDAFADYIQCAECGSSSHEEGFTPIDDSMDPDEAQEHLGL